MSDTPELNYIAGLIADNQMDDLHPADAKFLRDAAARIRELEAQIAEHEKVCAGTWVRCSERAPAEHRWFPGLYPGGFTVDTLFREGNYYRYGDAEPTNAITHWLD